MRPSLFLLIVLSHLVVLTSCSSKPKSVKIEASDFHNAVDKLTEVMVHDIFSPPVASRLYVYPNIAAYEVLSGPQKTYRPLSGQLKDLEIQKPDTNENLNLSLSALIAYLDVAKELVFSKDMMLKYRDSLYTKWDQQDASGFEQARDYGLKISAQIIGWMQNDGYAESRTLPDYNIYDKSPARWEPTPPAYMKGIEPHWNTLRPFVLDSAAQFKPVTHPAFSVEKGSPFHNELMEVYQLGNEIREKGDESVEVAIARFWDCNPFVSVNKGHFMFAEKKITPGAHWIGICKIACQQTQAGFERTVFAYTKTSMAIADAFISCWDEKYRSNLVRPETLINSYIDLDWAPILQTPPFPEYTSGHSVVSGAASEVLTDIFGDNFYFEDTTELPYGLPMRVFESFRAAAQEAAISRLYGGIHYKTAVVVGLEQGIKIGQLTNGKVQFLNN